MNMSNATAAGPSRGLLDILFSGSNEEADEADGKSFAPLMDIIKAMKEKGKEGDSSRTEEETALGKGMVDYRAVGMPGWHPSLMMEQPPPAEGDLERAGQLAALMAAAAVQKPAAGLETVDPSQVERILGEKSLPGLSAKEAKLLEAVNERIAKAQGEILLPEQPAVAEKAESAQRSALMQELLRKGIDPQLLKGQEGSGENAAPEKFLSTEAYMQMHERFTKGQTKEEGVKRMGGEGEETVSTAGQRSALASSEVTEIGKKNDDLFGKAGREPGDLLKGEAGGRKLDPSVLSFESSLQQSLKAESKDILLPGTKPEEMRPTLLNEVNQGVSLQALKGGGEMRLVINPPELGEIKLQIGTKNGKVDVQVTAQNEAVASVIRSGSKELERSLRDESLSLAKFDVTVTPDAPVAATDTRNSLSDQFLQQNQQNGFLQAGADDKGFNRWDGNQNQRQGSNAGSMAEDQGRNTASKPDSSRTIPARDSSRRLDVVA
jgi:flagellar hook-length control protein FliK